MLTISARKNWAGAAIDRAVRDALGSVAGCHLPTRAAFELLLRRARRSNVLRPPRSGGRFVTKGYGEVVVGLLSLATHHKEWLRPVEAWDPAGDNPLPQFSSLARHLLATYPVPAFMTSVWFMGQGALGRRLQGWFMHIGSGRNIRKADIPLAYTKMMAHHFLEAPAHFTVEAALRWGQVLGLGGSKGLARAVVATRLGQPVECENFWLTVIQFLVNHPELELRHVGPIVDYLHDQRFVPEEHFDGASDDVMWRPPQPELSMKGRTPRSLVRLVHEWQASAGLGGKRTGLRWPRSGLHGFRITEPGVGGHGLRVWTIRELLSSSELRAEGGAMHHCVADCVRICFKGLTSIWSMTVEDQDGRRRVLTIEVDPVARELVQASRCCNDDPKPKEREIMTLWAQDQGLKLLW
jgi:PcfJ-like protein